MSILIAVIGPILNILRGVISDVLIEYLSSPRVTMEVQDADYVFETNPVGGDIDDIHSRAAWLLGPETGSDSDP